MKCSPDYFGRKSWKLEASLSATIFAAMASTSAKSKKRRKPASPGGDLRPSKARLVFDSFEEGQGFEEVHIEDSVQSEVSDELYEERLWKNLRVILTLQNRDIDVEKKVDLAFNFVKTREAEERGSHEDYNIVKLPRLIVSICDWIQSLLISPGKKSVHGDKDFEACLDFRCWEVFRFCLQKSSDSCVSLKLSRNLLRAIGYVATNIKSILDTKPSPLVDTFPGHGFKVYDSMLKSVEMLFSSEDRLPKENLDLWLSTVEAVLDMLNKVYADKLYDSNSGSFVLKFSCLILEPFAKFLRIQPSKKCGFKDFVDKLLGPILNLLGHLHIQADDSSSHFCLSLQKLAEDILSHGLFNSVHIDGFLDLHSAEKHVESEDVKFKKAKMMPRSYHRHFFEKLDSVLLEKKELELSSMGQLLHLLTEQVSKIKMKSNQSDNEKLMSKTSNSKFVNSGLSMMFSTDDDLTEKSNRFAMNEGMRKSVFDFFVLLMEPLLLELHSSLQGGWEWGAVLVNVHCILRSANGLLSTLIEEMIYVKTEDNSEGACLQFLKDIYHMMIMVASNILSLPKCNADDSGLPQMFLFSVKELLVAVENLLNIDYDVIDNDLVGLWSLNLSCLAFCVALANSQDQCPIVSQVIGLSCRIVSLYAELRQVEGTIFALCEALRFNVSWDSGYRDKSFLHVTSSCPETMAKATQILFSSQELRLSVSSAIKSIPEGQGSSFIEQLVINVSESLEWMRHLPSTDDENFPDHFILLANVSGRGLSELYSLVLDSMVCTGGNCNLIGQAINKLIDVIRPSLSILVSPNPDSINKLLFAVTGRKFEMSQGEKRSSKRFLPTYWISVFFFRLYVSCRSLQRQVISFMPPDMAKRMACKMGDSLAASSGNDWIERSDWNFEGYFDWISQTSASLMKIFQSYSHIYLDENFRCCGPLLYTLQTMAVQRLSDLNAWLNPLNYLLQRYEKLEMTKKSRRLKKCISNLQREAVDLTDYTFKYLTIVTDEQNLDGIDSVPALQAIKNSGRWEFCISGINKSTLPTALWWIVCQNMDLWCPYAAKKKLKKFLSILIHSAITWISSYSLFVDMDGKYNVGGTTQMKSLLFPHISSELLFDSLFYEQQLVRRYLASMIGYVLDTTVSQLFSDLFKGEMGFRSPCDLRESLRMLEVAHISGLESNFSSRREPNTMYCEEEACIQSQTQKFKVCQSLLDLLSWISKAYLSSKLVQLSVTCAFNIERLVIVCLVKNKNKFSSRHMQNLLSLFVSCRRTVKCVIASCEETGGVILHELHPVLSDVVSLAMWLMKSTYAIVDLQRIFFKDTGCKGEEFIFSLMDHTSDIFLVISRYQFERLLSILIDSGKSGTPQDMTNGVDNHDRIDECDSGSLKNVKEWKYLLALAESLSKESESLQISLSNAFCVENSEIDIAPVTLNKISCIVSCFDGFLWGFRTLMEKLKTSNFPLKAILETSSELTPNLGRYVKAFSDFTTEFVQLLCIENKMRPQKQIDAQFFMGKKEDRSKLIFGDVDFMQTHHLKKQFLQCLLNGDNPGAAFALRHLLNTSAAFIGLNLQMNGVILPSWLVPTIAGISQVLLSGLDDLVEVPEQSFMWLDAVVNCLEEFVDYFPSVNPASTRDLFSRLIDLQLRAIGKCISLQGKRAALPSLQTFFGHMPSKEYPWRPAFINEFRGRLRLSLKVFIEKSSDLHFFSAIQAIERGLVGVRGTCTAVYSIQTGASDGGKVSSIAAASIDALDLVIGHASGRKRLNVIKRHIQNLIAAVFSIIVHLQSPVIFCAKAIDKEQHNCPDAGAVVLMCVEILTRISVKNAVFQMESWHTSQSLRIPGALFHELLTSQNVARFSGTCSLYPKNKCENTTSSYFPIMDRAFCMDLYAACCRLLHVAVKYHKSESERCLATLEESVTVLLHCLEIVPSKPLAQTSHFAWELEEGVKCASFLRRIYEELRQQKDVFGQHCFKFLSAYINIYSGFGPLKLGIRSVVDDALRPGVYALLDTCSPKDLQYLHTVFGESPCRNTLANLRHDYKLNFRYDGKV